MAYQVCTELFEGPLDLLLRLINEQRVELYDLRLSEIVDAYLAEIAHLEHLDLEVATEFLLIASILVELKSRRLLPRDSDHVNEDDLLLLEERDCLLARLVECTTFFAAGRRIAELELEASRSWPRSAGPDESFEHAAPDLLAGICGEDLAGAAAAALAERPAPRVAVEHILVDEVTVAEVVGRLASKLEGSGQLTFRQLTLEAASRIEIVVHFLALLELYKQGLIDLDQVETFGELSVTWLGRSGEAHDDAVLVEAEYRG